MKAEYPEDCLGLLDRVITVPNEPPEIIVVLKHIRTLLEKIAEANGWNGHYEDEA